MNRQLSRALHKAGDLTLGLLRILAVWLVLAVILTALHFPYDTDADSKRLKILLVSSGGGHWVQLMRVASAFAEHDCVYGTRTHTDWFARLRNATPASDAK